MNHTHTSAYTCVNIHVWTYTCMNIHTYEHTHMNVHMCKCTHVWTYTHMNIQLYEQQMTVNVFIFQFPSMSLWVFISNIKSLYTPFSHIGQVEVWISKFLTSTLDGSGWWTSCHGSRGAGTRCTGGWFEEEVNLLSMSGFDLHIAQTVVWTLCRLSCPHCLFGMLVQSCAA
jgi:hypothetical protein